MSAPTIEAPPAPAGTVRPPGAVLAAVLVVLAAAGVLIDLPATVRAPLTLLAVAATATRLSRHRRRGGLDALLVAVGGSLVVIALTGMLLGLSPAGLHPGSWALALAVLALVALAVSALRPPALAPQEEPARDAVRPGADPSDAVGSGAVRSPGDVGDERRRALLRTAPWAAVAVAVTVVALVVSVRSTSEGEVTPVQMSLAGLSGTQAVVVVSAQEATGPLELRTDPGDGSAVTYPLFSVPADGTVSTTVVVPSTGRVVVTISNPGQVRPLRTLVVNR
ncbi:hypothetical protein GTR02_17665 [Kineococcus sp. R8]|uniref:hypothetical protein n=1 Tax=Kineococcus siccus TaxID=2696567 RepID=UPI0014128D97|nr:hypothetical protein [Kineococcus siccus]NAZ83643.1 hypothetical protein [Kineococcus siccus]